MRKFNNHLIKISCSVFALLVLLCSIGNMPVKAASPKTGNFSSPTATEITNNSATISVQLTAKTYVKSYGFFLGTNTALLYGNIKSASKTINGNLNKGTYLYFSATTKDGKVSGLKSNTKYYYMFYYYDRYGNLVISGIKSFQTKAIPSNTASNCNTSSSMSTRIKNFISDARWKNNAEWGYYKIPYIAEWSGSQHGIVNGKSGKWCIGCCAYVADFCKYVYRRDSVYNADFTSHNDLAKISVGDIVKINKGATSTHWIAIIGKNGNKLSVAEGNILFNDGTSHVYITNDRYTIYADSSNGCYLNSKVNGKVNRIGQSYVIYHYNK